MTILLEHNLCSTQLYYLLQEKLLIPPAFFGDISLSVNVLSGEGLEREGRTQPTLVHAAHL